jgi:hypothetical protein
VAADTCARLCPLAIAASGPQNPLSAARAEIHNLYTKHLHSPHTMFQQIGPQISCVGARRRATRRCEEVNLFGQPLGEEPPEGCCCDPAAEVPDPSVVPPPPAPLPAGMRWGCTVS